MTRDDVHREATTPPLEMMTRLVIGDIELFSFVENRTLSDGGAMYGVIPKSLWSKSSTADENNLVPMDTNLLLIKTRKLKILVDCGLGDALTDRQKKIYGCHSPSRLDECIARLALVPEDIDIVIASHLHLDHIGGAFAGHPDDIKPRFPRARHIIRDIEWNTAMNPDDRSMAAYPTEMLRRFEEFGLIEMIDSDIEAGPGVKLVLTGGHTRGHQVVEIESGEQKVIFCADMIPVAGNLKPTYIAATDLFPLETLEYKKKLIEDAVRYNWILALDHDTEYKFVTLKRENGKIVPVKQGEPFLVAMSSCSQNIRDSKKSTR